MEKETSVDLSWHLFHKKDISQCFDDIAVGSGNEIVMDNIAMETFTNR